MNLGQYLAQFGHEPTQDRRNHFFDFSKLFLRLLVIKFKYLMARTYITTHNAILNTFWPLLTKSYEKSARTEQLKDSFIVSSGFIISIVTGHNNYPKHHNLNEAMAEKITKLKQKIFADPQLRPYARTVCVQLTNLLIMRLNHVLMGKWYREKPGARRASLIRLSVMVTDRG